MATRSRDDNKVEIAISTELTTALSPQRTRAARPPEAAPQPEPIYLFSHHRISTEPSSLLWRRDMTSQLQLGGSNHGNYTELHSTLPAETLCKSRYEGALRGSLKSFARRQLC